MKKAIALFCLCILALNAHAIAVIPPAMYIATLSIIAFISNLLITAAVYAAAKGMFSANTFKKGFSSTLGLVLEIIGKAALIIISTTIAVLAINPITIEESIIAGIIAATITLIALLFNAYKRLAILEGKEKRAILKEALLVFVFVILASSAASYASIELKAITTQGYDAPVQKPVLEELGDAVTSGLSQSAPSMIASDSEISDTMRKESAPLPVEEKTAPVLLDLVFLPKSAEECIISSETRSISITPKMNCVVLENGARIKAICPIILPASDFYPDKNISTSGSCTEEYQIE